MSFVPRQIICLVGKEKNFGFSMLLRREKCTVKTTQTLVIDHNPVQKIKAFFCSIIYIKLSISFQKKNIKLSIEIAVKIILARKHGCTDEVRTVQGYIKLSFSAKSDAIRCWYLDCDRVKT